MTDSERLKRIIYESGIKTGFLAEKLGISRQGLYKKLEEGSDFKAWQMFIFVEVLHLSEDDTRAIFLNPDVAKTDTE